MMPTLHPAGMSIWSLLGHVLLIFLPPIFFVSCRRLIRRSNSTRVLSEPAWPEEANKSYKNQAEEADTVAMLSELPWPEEANQAHKKQAKKADHILRAGLLRPDLSGMDDYEIKVLDFLEYGKAPLLGIHGMRGVGKTTLLKLVRTCYRQRSSFRYVFYAEAGNGFTVDMLRGVLARNIGLDPMAAVNRISNFLRDESFLLLLDNVSASFDLAAAGLPITLGPRQKVIFTTRNEAVCTEMGCAGNAIQMYCLVGDVAWNLFKHNVGNRIIDSDPEIKYLAKQMVAHCRGFPSALCTVGRSMSIRKDVKEWIFAHKLLMKGSPPNGFQDTNDEDYPCLETFEDEF